MIYCENHVIVTYFDGSKKQTVSFNLMDIAFRGSLDKLLSSLRSFGYIVISISFDTLD